MARLLPRNCRRCGCLVFVAETGGGLYWLVPAIVFLLLVGLTNAWVLLVEILR
jgi:hypothetical protein